VKLVALLPMKAHSERVPGKNFKDIAGKPLFRWVLGTLLATPEVEKVVINTDARQTLADHGLEDGGRIVIRDRPEAIRGDFVSMNRIIEEDLANVDGDWFLQTHTTNPLLHAATISDAVGALESNDQSDSLFSVTKLQTRFYWEDGRPVNHNPANLKRTQDLPPLYEENSNIYLFTRESFAKTSARIGAKPMMFPMNATEAIDIDDAESWSLAERLLEVRAFGFS
jgi:CMP-N-acetylneuraminic acid synthetase